MNTKVILVTCPIGAKSEAIAKELVDAGLAACVNIIPGITSIYRWQGKVEKEAESLLVIKSSAAQLKALEEKVLEIHPYETPEFVVLDASFVTERYSNWLQSVLT